MSDPTTSASEPAAETAIDPVVGPDAYAELPETAVAGPPAVAVTPVPVRRRRDERGDDDWDEPSPPTVLAAMGFGFVPVPFLAMYAVLFISRGFIVPVTPPDVTGSATGEGWVGVGALVLIVAVSLAIAWYVAARRRWPFVVLQLAVVGFAVYCLYDRDTGPIWIPLVVLFCAVVALVCVFLPDSHRRFPPPPRLRRGVRAPAGSVTAPEPASTEGGSTPTSAEDS